MEVKLLKKLGAGVNGTAYLAESKGKKYVYKIEKYVPESAPLKHSYYRQVDFDEKVAQKHKDKFMTLKQHGIINECQHKQAIPHWAKGTHKKKLIAKNGATECFFLLYEPVLSHTVHSMSKEIFASPKLWRKMCYQLVEQMNILKKSGFSHNDIHNRNVMYHKGNFHIIDYGLVSHPNYPANKEDKITKKYGHDDMVMFLWNISILNEPAIYMYNKRIKFPSMKVFYARLIKTPEYKSLKPKFPHVKHPGLQEDLEAFIHAIHFPEQYAGLLNCPSKTTRVIVPDLGFMMVCCRYFGADNYSGVLTWCRNNWNYKK
jgi:serine/threonine protein kinase